MFRFFSIVFCWTKFCFFKTLTYLTHIPTRKVQSWKFMQDIWHHFPWLFTKRNMTCGVPEMEDGKILHNCNNFRWNRVKMAKNGQKMAEINFGVSYIIIFFIFNFFCFSTFTFSYFLEQVFWVKFLKFCQNSGLLKYQMEKVEKQKKVKMKKFIMYETPKLISCGDVWYGIFSFEQTLN